MSDPNQPRAHEADAAAGTQNPNVAATASPNRTPADQAPTEPIAPDDDRRAAATDAPVGPGPRSAPVDRKTAPARSALIAGAAGLAVVAGALGFGAGYITGDTTSDRPAPAAVWQQGGNGPGMGAGQMGGPQMGGPGMGGLPGLQNRDGESGSESDEGDGQNTSPGSPTQQQGQADTGA